MFVKQAEQGLAPHFIDCGSGTLQQLPQGIRLDSGRAQAQNIWWQGQDCLLRDKAVAFLAITVTDEN